ncbi:hypothetical protein H4R21_003149, partial [Coemansia helicoidea]
MLISADPRDPLDQHERILDYLELDPYAPEQYLDRAVERALAAPAADSEEPAEAALRLVVDRVERGDPGEAGKWRHLARLVSHLQRTRPAAVDAVMDARREWWGESYFGWATFEAACITDRLLYMA